MYQKVQNDLLTGQPARVIKRLTDGSTIPMDERNTDYQDFLKWQADGGVIAEVGPLPAGG